MFFANKISTAAHTKRKNPRGEHMPKNNERAESGCPGTDSLRNADAIYEKPCPKCGEPRTSVLPEPGLASQHRGH
jgi:hypothetical protein